MSTFRSVSLAIRIYFVRYGNWKIIFMTVIVSGIMVYDVQMTDFSVLIILTKRSIQKKTEQFKLKIVSKLSISICHPKRSTTSSSNCAII